MKTDKTVAVILRAEQINKIKKQAEKKGISFSRAIREILDRNKEMDFIVTLNFTKEEYAKILKLAEKRKMGIKQMIKYFIDEDGGIQATDNV